jgi:hypothetical protein
MKVCKRLTEVLEGIAKKYGIDTAREQKVRLQRPVEGSPPLHLGWEVGICGQLGEVCVARYCERSGVNAKNPAPLGDPEIRLARTKEGLVPLSICRGMLGSRTCAEVRGQEVHVTDAAALTAAAEDAEQWAELLDGYVTGDASVASCE